MKHTAIPSFALYGEEPQALPAGFLHIETIAVRSSLHDWEIRPHRHELNMQVLLVQDGQVEASLDGAILPLDAPCFVAVPQGAVHGFRFAPDTRGHVLTLSAEFLARMQGREDPLLALLTQGGHGSLAQERMERIDWLATQLLALTASWAEDRLLVHALFEALLRSLPFERQARPFDDRIARFRLLVEQHLHEQRPVGFYAARLDLSQRSLARLCQSQLGCSPGEAINRRLAMEAQRLLRYANASAVQVSDALGFADPSYFSRFYRRMTGRRPSEERTAAKDLPLGQSGLAARQ